MKEIPEPAYQIEELNPEDLQIAREQNMTELARNSRTRIYTVEETRTFPDRVEFSYGWFTYELPLEAKSQIRPGSKILVVQRSENITSTVEGVYSLGENLVELGTSELPVEPSP